MNAKYSFPWEREAMRGCPLPEGLPSHEQMSYLALRQVYRDYYAKAISRDAASREKRSIVQTAKEEARSREFSDKLTRKHFEILKGTELAASACRKNPTLENTLRLCDVIVGLKVMELRDEH